MSENKRKQRLQSELRTLQSLQKESTIFEFEPAGEPPDRYTITLSGKGLARSPSDENSVRPIDKHRVDLRLPYAFPESPPDIRWVTPIHHPNISFSGFLSLSDIGLPWTENLGLDAVCERLWDMARYAYVDLDNAANYGARSWYIERGQNEIQPPLDARPLRDSLRPRGSNVVRYRRRRPSVANMETQSDDEILYIGDDAPQPQQTKDPPRTSRRAAGDDEIFFIGE